MKRASLAIIFLAALTCFAQEAPRAQRATGGSYQISGRVIHAVTGQPLAGVSMTLGPAFNAPRPVQRPMRMQQREDENPAVVTGGDGSFTFTGLRAGRYSLVASKRGFSPQTYNEHEQFSSAIVLGPDNDPGEILFRIQPDASLVGRVVDEHNEPVATAQVILFREGMQNGRRGIYRAGQTQTSDEGLYKFAHLRAGKCYVAVTGSPWYSQYAMNRRFVMNGGSGTGGGQVYADDSNNPLDVAFPVTFYPGVTDSGQAETIELKPGQRETADFTLNAVPALHLRIITSTNEDQQQFVTPTLIRQVFDSTEIGGVRTRMTTISPGITEVSGLTPGHYLVQIHNNGPSRGPASAVGREIDIAGDTEINAADPPTGVNVTGTLRLDGAAPDEARLVLRRRGGGAPIQLQVNAKGEISSPSPVPSDAYELMLPSPLYQMTQITASGAKLTGQSLQIGNNDVRLSIIASKASAHVGGVALKDGKPTSGAMVVLVPTDMSRPLLYRRDESDSDGSFNLNGVPPGKYTVVAISDWNVEWSNPDMMKPLLTTGEPIEVAADGKYDVKVNVQ